MRIEFDGETESLTVNGVTVHLGVLEAMTKPQLDQLYHFVREGDVVTVTRLYLEPLPQCQIAAPPKVYETRVVTPTETKSAKPRPRF